MSDMGTPRRQTFTGLLAIRLTKFWWDFVEVFAAFFNVGKDDSKEQAAENAKRSFLQKATYVTIDYSLAGIFASLVLTMNAWGYSFLMVTLVGWTFDIVAAGMF